MCIIKDEFFSYFPYALQPILSPHIASRILFAFTVNPTRIFAFVTEVDMEQPPRRRVPAVEVSLPKVNNLLLMPRHFLNYQSRQDMPTDSCKVFSEASRIVRNH